MKYAPQFSLILFVILVGCLSFLYSIDRQILSDLKEGRTTLHCNIDGYEKQIPPEMIVDKYNDTFIFTNGYSKTCTIKH
jgi:hypothetical protein